MLERGDERTGHVIVMRPALANERREGRLRQQALSLIEPDRLDVDAGCSGECTDGQIPAVVFRID